MEIKKVELLQKSSASKLLSIGSGCIIIDNGKVLLVRGKGGTSFKFPGGHITDEENFKQSAQRECSEEIGCEVRAMGDPIFYLFKLNEELDIILIHYLGEIIKGEPTPTTEIEEVKWFDINSLPENIFDNVIPVLKTFKKNII